jgi:hypothetical protein
VDHNAAASWNAAYAAGHFRNKPPVSFVDDIVATARQHGLRRGRYIGCGNGRNLIPLLDAGLDLIGLDISTGAIAQLHQQHPDPRRSPHRRRPKCSPRTSLNTTSSSEFRYSSMALAVKHANI